jgi:hypothetical protein
LIKKNLRKTMKLCLATAIAAPVLYSSHNGITQAAPTTFLNKDALISKYAADGQWYKNNIPFFEISDPQIQDTYYYRWNLYKAHIRNLGSRNVITEFLNQMSWDTKPSNTISDAAGFHIYEGRWLKDRRYVNDYIDFWYSEGNPRQYSEWIGDATYAKFLADGDRSYAIGHLGDMKSVYNAWADHYDASRSLYWQVPLSDATEYTIASIDASGGADGFTGGDSFRPSINSYMFANAKAISSIAALAGDTATANDYASRAASIKTNLQNSLWNSTFNHFADRYKVSNQYVTNWNFIRGRELVGYVPWYHNLPDNNATFNSAWSHVMDTNKFYGAYGLRTVEPTYQYYMRQYRYDAATGLVECQWNGPSWPYQTTQVLGGMANLLNNYTQNYVTSSDYMKILKQYTAQHYNNGVNYLSENYHPDRPGPIVDLPERSQHYNHSGYVDLIVTGLAGLRPRSDNVLEVNPIIPTNANDPNYIRYFALEDIPYHGHSVTILYDAAGTRYNQGVGLSVYVDGARVIGPTTLGKKTVAIGAPIVTTTETPVNLAANQSGSGFPAASASHSYSTDPAVKANDGRVWYYQDTKNRWSSFGSNNATDWYAVDFGSVKTVSSAKLYLFSDNLGLRTPQSYNLQYWNGSAWINIPNQVKSPAAPAGNTENTVNFAEVNTSRIRVVFKNAGGGYYTGMTEFEAYGSGITTGASYRLVNYNSGKVLGVSGMSTTDGAQAVQWSDTNTNDHNWRLDLQANGYYKITNLHSGKVLGVNGMSTSDGAQAVQWADNGTADHEWKLERTESGLYKIINRHSSKVLAMNAASTADGAVAVQWADTGTPDQRWALALNTGLASGATYKLQNLNSAKVLGITGMSVADGAQAVQWADTGTPDHNWRVQLLKNGYYKLTNVNSGKVLGVDQMISSNGGNAVQFADNGSADQAWQLIDMGGGNIKLINKHSKKVLGINNMSTTDGANALQWSDNATNDQRWKFVAVP